ncbi:FCN1 [Branchiostoma lanceolatum]|nr:FCN1 [Branchiostoma lanceolatum]
MKSQADVRPVTFTVTANTGDPVTLQMVQKSSRTGTLEWRKGGVGGTVLTGQNGLNLTIASVQSSDEGIYECYYQGDTERKQGIMRLIVRGCTENKWGPPSCTDDCPVCYNGGVCDDNTGECVCPPGFHGHNCESACVTDKIGTSCTRECEERNCTGQLLCVMDPYGCSCAPGLMGIQCNTACPDGMFGAGCTQTCHCANGPAACDMKTGACTGGCPDFWFGESCQIACGHCYMGQTCDGSNGTCPTGGCHVCAAGYHGVKCDQACQDGLYGADCAQTCHCANGPAACNKTTGACTGGCHDLWTGDSCQIRTASVSYEDLFTKEEGRFFGGSSEHITAYNDIDADECARRCLQGYGSYDGVNPPCLSFNHRPAGSPEGGSARCWLRGSDKDTAASPDILAPQDCTDVFALGILYSHVSTIGHPQPFQVYCDMDTDGGGWTVIQRRQDGSVPFDKSWTEYEQGFGNTSGEYWLGLGNIHSLTSQKQNELYVYLEDWEMNSRFARYSTFSVGDAGSKYTATIDGYSGDASDSLDRSTRHSINNRQFSTTDQDNDPRNDHCANLYGQGGWWYTDSCGLALLNGQYLTGCSVPAPPSCSSADGIVWYNWRGYAYSLKTADMMIRPDNFPECHETYGPDCITPCGHCYQNRTCDRFSGACPSSDPYTCEAGYQVVKCDQECAPGNYSYECAEPCGNCASGTVCNSKDGTCPSGCREPWAGTICKQIPASIQQHPDNQTTVVEQTATFICTSQGVPTPNVTWYHGGRVISDGGRVSIEVSEASDQHTVTSTLTISPVKREDAGGYFCTAHDSIYGDDTSQVAELTVQEIQSTTSPTKTTTTTTTATTTTVNETTTVRTYTSSIFRSSSVHTTPKSTTNHTTPFQSTKASTSQAQSTSRQVSTAQTAVNTTAELQTTTDDVNVTIPKPNILIENAGEDSATPGNDSTHVIRVTEHIIGIQDITVGETVTIRCDAEDLAAVCVMYKWRVDGEVLDGQNGQILRYTPETDGPHKIQCTAINNGMDGVSDVITVFALPKGKKLDVMTRCDKDPHSGVSWDNIVRDCDLHLHELAEIPVTSMNALDVAGKLKNITTSDNVTVDNVGDVRMIFENVVNASSQPEVRYSLLETVDQLMDTDDDVLQNSQKLDSSPSKIVQAMEESNDRIDLTDGKFSHIGKNVGVEVFEMRPAELTDGVVFALLDDGSDTLNNATVRTYIGEDAALMPADEVVASIALPDQLALEATSDDVRLSFTIFQSSKLFQTDPTVDVDRGFLPQTVNSKVIAGRISGLRTKNLSKPVILKYFPVDRRNMTNITCVFWDFAANNGGGAWSSDGCSFGGMNKGRIVCECHHLTNFAVLTQHTVHQNDFAGLIVICKILCGLILIGLAFTLITHVAFEQLRQYRSQVILMNICFALLATLVSVLLGIGWTDNDASCRAVTFFLHYFLLAYFAWTAIEAYNMNLAFEKDIADSMKRFILKTAVAGWGFPFAIALITLVSDVQGYRSDNFCWLEGNQLLIGFLLPGAVVLCFNTVTYIIIVRKLRQPDGPKDGKLHDNVTKKTINLGIIIMILMGLQWILGFILIRDAELAAACVFFVLSSLQGLFIALFRCLLQEDVRSHWLTCCSRDADTSTDDAVTSTLLKTPSSPAESHDVEKSEKKPIPDEEALHPQTNGSHRIQCTAHTEDGEGVSDIVTLFVKPEEIQSTTSPTKTTTTTTTATITTVNETTTVSTAQTAVNTTAELKTATDNVNVTIPKPNILIENAGEDSATPGNDSTHVIRVTEHIIGIQDITVGETVTIRCDAEDLPEVCVMYKWRVDGEVLDGQNGQILRYTPETDGPHKIQCTAINNGMDGVSDVITVFALPKGKKLDVMTRCDKDPHSGVSWDNIVRDCDLHLHELAEIPVTSMNALDVAGKLKNITTSDNVTVDNVGDVRMIFENVVNASSQPEVGYSLLETVDKLMDTDDDVLQNSQKLDSSPSKIVQAMEESNDRIDLTDGKFSHIGKNVGVEVFEMRPAELADGVVFALLDDGSDTLNNATVRTYIGEDAALMPADEVVASIALPDQLALEATSDDVRLSFTIFQSSKLFQTDPTVDVDRGFLPSTINSKVIAGRISGLQTKNLSKPVVLKYLPVDRRNMTNITCVFWDFAANNGGGAWSSDGCSFGGVNKGRIVCECHHLTNFAVLTQHTVHQNDFAGLIVICKILCGLILIGLAFTLITHVAFEQLRQYRSQVILMNICFALLATLVSVLLGIGWTENDASCRAVTFFLHYFLLAYFAWTAIEAYNMNLAFEKDIADSMKRFILKTAVAGWGFPFAIALITLVSDVQGYRSDNFCWLEGNQLLIGFLLPGAVVLCFNTVTYIIIVRKLRQPDGPKDGKLHDNVTKKTINLGIIIMILMGLQWILGFILIRDAELAVACVFFVLSSLQGLFVALFRCLLQEDVRSHWLTCCSRDADTSTDDAVTSTLLKTPSSPPESNDVEKSEKKPIEDGEAVPLVITTE